MMDYIQHKNQSHRNNLNSRILFEPYNILDPSKSNNSDLKSRYNKEQHSGVLHLMIELQRLVRSIKYMFFLDMKYSGIQSKQKQMRRMLHHYKLDPVQKPILVVHQKNPDLIPNL